MSQSQPDLPGFKAVTMSVGVAYVLLASFMLVSGGAVMRDFAVPESVVTAPVFEDFFSFFYQLMAFVGVLSLVFGQVARGQGAQTLVAFVFCAANVLLTLRDLSTSDSMLGNRLYRGSGTLIPVYIDAAIAVAFGALTITGWRRTRLHRLSGAPPLLHGDG